MSYEFSRGDLTVAYICPPSPYGDSLLRRI
jgi:hypothetical protein